MMRLNRIKKLFIAFSGIILMALCLITFPAEATENNNPSVVDNANLLTDKQRVKLTERIESLKKDCECDILIFTSKTPYTGDFTDYVAHYYFNHGYGYKGKKDGIVLFIDMYDRNVATQTFGKFNKYHEKVRDKLNDFALDEVRDGNYYKACDVFLDKAPTYLKGKRGFYSLSAKEILIAVGVPVLLFCAIFVGVKKSYGSDGKEKPYPFKEKANIKLTVNEDTFISEHTTSFRTESSSGSGGGSSSHSSSSGSSSASSGKF